MTVESIRENLVKATPANGKRLVSVGGKTIAEGCVYAPSLEALAAWAEVDLAKVEELKAQWESETEEMEVKDTDIGEKH